MSRITAVRSIAVRPEQLLEVELLGGRQVVVEHDRVGVDRQAQLAQLVDLALADVPRVVGRVAPLHEATDDVGAGGVDEQLELVEAGVGVVFVDTGQGDADQHDLLPDRPVDQREAKRFLIRGGSTELRAIVLDDDRADEGRRAGRA